jgi:UDP-N-acetylmuramate dehydrogenase
MKAETEDDLVAARTAVVRTGVPVLVVGRGSNLLVADAGFPGLAITLGEGFATIEVDGTRVRAGAAVSLPVLARQTAAAGLTGLEWAVGVPGSVGGAVRMNAGGHGSDTAEHLRRYRFVDLTGGEDGTFDAARLEFAYRHSTVGPGHVVVWGEYELAPGDPDTSATEISEIVRWRREHQPGGQNAGSVFTNPPGDSAGRLVDAAGLKGHRIGTAHVSTKHANFIQADEGGSADDVWHLVREVQRLVEERTGIHLEPELRVVGFSQP